MYVTYDTISVILINEPVARAVRTVFYYPGVTFRKYRRPNVINRILNLCFGLLTGVRVTIYTHIPVIYVPIYKAGERVSSFFLFEPSSYDARGFFRTH